MKTKRKIILFDIDYTILDTDELKKSELTNFTLYKEVLPLLKLLKNIAELGIFSEGDISFQKKKLHETQIEQFFLQEHTYIFEKKNDRLQTVLQGYTNDVVYLVDDKPEVLSLAKNIHPSIITIWIKRGFYALRPITIENFSPDFQLSTLETLNEIITDISYE